MHASSVSIPPTAPRERARRNYSRLSIIRPLRFSHPSEARPPDGQQDKLAGVRAIRPPGPTVSIRPASLLYRAPTALHGTASHLLRHILRASSPAAPSTTKPPPESPVKFLSLPTKNSRQPHGPLFRNEAILNGFLLNNGGYLDDSESESEPDDCDTPDPSVLDLTQPSAHSPNQTTKSISDISKSRSSIKTSILYF